MRLPTALFIAFALAIWSPSPGVASPAKDIVVKFDAGANGATLPGELGSEEAFNYILGARKNQFLKVSLRPDNALTYMIISVPGGKILHESTQAGNEYYGQLYLNGDHVVQVFYKGEPGTKGKYDIAFAISDNPIEGDAGGPPATGGDSSLSADDRACLKAVAEQTGNPTVVILSREESEANNAVIVGIGPQKAPWQCLVKDGIVAGIMSLTNEGAN